MSLSEKKIRVSFTVEFRDLIRWFECNEAMVLSIELETRSPKDIFGGKRE